MLRTAISLLLIVTTSTPLAAEVKEAIILEWSECTLIAASMETQRVRSTAAEKVRMMCGIVDTDSVVVCDYYNRDGTLKNTPSVFHIEADYEGYVFSSNGTNSTRLHLNLRDGRAILKANFFDPAILDGFGVKLCAGKIALRVKE